MLEADLLLDGQMKQQIDDSSLGRRPAKQPIEQLAGFGPTARRAGRMEDESSRGARDQKHSPRTSLSQFA